MGIIIAKFRKKQTTVEILEGIDKEISNLQRFRRHNQEQQKKLIASLILYSIVIYIVCAIVFYFWYFPDTWQDRFLYSLPLLAFPFLVWALKKILHWYFVKRIASNDVSLGELRDKKKQILEDVMEKETYKKAKEILEKFDPYRFKQLEKPAQPSPRQPTPTQGSALRQRVTPRMMTPMRPGGPVRPGTPMTTPHLPRSTGPPGSRPRMTANGQFMPGYGMPPGPPLPRPVPPRERGKFDKFVEYILADGPQSRYALICKYCHSHNGMALKEEFEYLSFRCCYCYGMNHARKQRPHAPRLEFPAPPSPQKQAVAQGPGQKSSSQDEDEDDDDDEDYDEEEGSTESGSGRSTPSDDKKPVTGGDTKTSTESTSVSAKMEVKEKDLKFADDEGEGDSRETTLDKPSKVEDHKEAPVVKGELRTE